MNDIVQGSLFVLVGGLLLCAWLYYVEALLQAFRRSRLRYRWIVLLVPGAVFFREPFDEDAQAVRWRAIRAGGIATASTILVLVLYVLWQNA